MRMADIELPFVSRKKYDELEHKFECFLTIATGNILSKASNTLENMEYWYYRNLEDKIDDAVSEAIGVSNET